MNQQPFRARRRVVWDALPLAWAALLMVLVVNYWWGIRAAMAVALLARSRRWDWAALTVIAAAFTVRLATQLVR